MNELPDLFDTMTGMEFSELLSRVEVETAGDMTPTAIETALDNLDIPLVNLMNRAERIKLVTALAEHDEYSRLASESTRRFDEASQYIKEHNQRHEDEAGYNALVGEGLRRHTR